MKKIFLFFISVLLLSSCSASSFSPIPTAANRGGILGTTQRILHGDFSDFKSNEKKEEKPNVDTENLNNMDKEKNTKLEGKNLPAEPIQKKKIK